MGEIRILEDRLVNQIAAGEVIERPAAALKELVENSLDAGATRIHVQLEAGGRNLIRVVDNGRGMDDADALMCLERHGTSKIRVEEDLFRVASLGFRGEALPSIASVSRFELLTRPGAKREGQKVVVDGGRLRSRAPAGCPEGTQVSVRSLFYNMPVRRKFLRTVPTELGHCAEAIISQALIRPEVDWTLEHNGQVLLRAPIAKSRKERASDLLKGQGQSLFPVQFSAGDLEVEALLSPVGVHQAAAKGSLYLFVNGRYVRDALVRKAVREAYRHIVPKGRFPVVVLEVRVPPEEVDVNIHPSKTEVRFRHGRDMVQAVSQGLRDALEAHGIRRPMREFHPPVSPSSEGSARQAGLAFSRPAPPEPVAVQPMEAFPESSFSESSFSPKPAGSLAAEVEPAAVETASGLPKNDLLPVARFADLVVLGQLLGTYLVCEGGNEMILIDQHAAHERIMLHHLMQNAQEHLGGAQRLLTATVVDMPLHKAQLLEDNLGVLAELQFEVEPYGGGAFAVRAVPPLLAKVDIEKLLHDVADGLAVGQRGNAGRDIQEHVMATMACHNSVRAHQRLSDFEMRKLLEALDEVDFGVCAHGRPVAIRISESELERRFHRA
jgi:DNA mismatch repair protein MutL